MTMKLIKKIRIISYTVISLSVLISCTGTGKIDISLDAESEFPVISIANPSGKEVKLNPVSPDRGSIGFQKDGLITWIKGMPSKSKNGTTFIWEIDDNTKVRLQTYKDNGDLNCQLSLEGRVSETPDKWYINLKAEEDEYFTGLLERVVDGHQRLSWQEDIKTAMNLRGENIEMKIKPTVSAYAPFYISSASYGFFVRGTWPGMFDMCKEFPDVVQVSFEGPVFDFKLYLGSSVQEIVQKHALETGPSFVPPDWAYGPWRWRDEHFNKNKYYDSTEVMAPFNSDLVEDVLMMQAYDIPFNAYWIDRPWSPGVRGFDDYIFDTLRFPEPEKMIKWLNSKGIELMIWIAPFVMGNMADYAEENSYHLMSKPWWRSRQVLMDFTNPEACKWWAENGPGKLAAMGIKGFKLDRADGEKLADSIHLKTYAGTSYRENYNDYPRQYVKAAYDAVKSVLGNDFILYPRAQYTGSAKYGGMWSGDTDGKPEGLRSVIIAMQRCAIMGQPIWASDIGGYWGKFSHETCKRWLAFGCFCPIMETGPTNNRGFWNNPQEPFYDTELIAIWRLYSKIRMKLVPHVQSLAKEANETGMPIARPLFLVYPEQKEAWNDWQTYMFGPDILVSAVWETGKEKHTLYLPSGNEWIDAWDIEKVYSGGEYIEVKTPVYKIPVFIRKGSDIDLGDLNALYSESLKIASEKPDIAELEKKEGWR
jgi:alpha-D-xyloside xylohydrolase